MDGLAGYIIRRLMFVPITLFVVSFATFTITRLGPGDPVSIYSGQYRDEEAFDRVRAKYGLDKPIHEQYGIWVKDVALHGDFGPSFLFRDRDITDILRTKIWVSFRVGVYSFFLAFLIGIPIGVFAAVKQGTFLDPFIIGLFLFFQSLHSLVLVPMLVLIFAAQLHWLPPGGFDGMLSKSMIIPTVSLTLPSVAGIARLARTLTVQTLYEDFVRTARAKGLDESTVMVRHVARNSLVPMFTTVVGLSLVGLVEGAIFTETVLGINGIGSFIYQAVNSRDYNVILAFVMLTTTIFVLANVLVDVVLVLLDPRVRVGGASGR